MKNNNYPDAHRSSPTGVVRPSADEDQEPSDMVERLLQIAGEGPQVPADGAARIRTAVRPLWQQEVQVRAQQRRTARAWTASLATAASLIIAVTVVTLNRQASADPIAHLEAVTGSVEIHGSDGTIRQAATGDVGLQLSPGAWLRTGEGSRIALGLGDGRSVRLDVATRLRLSSTAELDLARGGVYIDTGGDTGVGRGLAVRTALGVARDIGTQFEVRVDQERLNVRVREGQVLLRCDGEELPVSQGTALQVAADGSRAISSEPSYSPHWEWVQEVAPPVDIEGLSVIAFLDWVSRETGLWIHFADPEVETLAGATVLHGTIEGLTPRQAPQVVLPSCGLTVREGGPGTLLVTRSENGDKSR